MLTKIDFPSLMKWAWLTLVFMPNFFVSWLSLVDTTFCEFSLVNEWAWLMLVICQLSFVSQLNLVEDFCKLKLMNYSQNIILLWHVVLPSMPKREIFGYNWFIVCSLLCYTNVISIINRCIPSSLGYQNNFLKMQC